MIATILIVLICLLAVAGIVMMLLTVWLIVIMMGPLAKLCFLVMLGGTSLYRTIPAHLRYGNFWRRKL